MPRAIGSSSSKVTGIADPLDKYNRLKLREVRNKTIVRLRVTYCYKVLHCDYSALNICLNSALESLNRNNVVKHRITNEKQKQQFIDL